MGTSRVLDIARAHVGLCCCGPWREQFRNMLGPTVPGFVWDLARRFIIHVQGVSTCSSCCRAWMRLAGVDLPPGFYPFSGKDSFWGEHAWAERIGAATTGRARVGSAPSPGDIFWTPSHMGVIDQWGPTDNPYDSPAGQDVWTIDGGQECERSDAGHEGKHLQAVHSVHRRFWFAEPEGVPHISTVLSPTLYGPKSEVLGWIRTADLPYKE